MSKDIQLSDVLQELVTKIAASTGATVIISAAIARPAREDEPDDERDPKDGLVYESALALECGGSLGSIGTIAQAAGSCTGATVQALRQIAAAYEVPFEAIAKIHDSRVGDTACVRATRVQREEDPKR